MPFNTAKGVAIRHKATEKLRNMDHKDLAKTGFWVSQLFVILATIIGVYLAANAGLRQALMFDKVTKQESNYYLRRSIYDELADNVLVLRLYAEETLARNPPHSELLNNRPLLSRFVWDNLRYSANTLETPSLFLTESRRFYLQVDDIIARAENRTWSTAHAGAQLGQLLDVMEHQLLPQLQDNYQALGRNLTAYGVDLNHLK